MRVIKLGMWEGKLYMGKLLSGKVYFDPQIGIWIHMTKIRPEAILILWYGLFGCPIITDARHDSTASDFHTTVTCLGILSAITLY